MYTYPEDTGTYTCRAINALGQATNQANLSVRGKAVIQKEAIHESAMGQIHFLEQAHRREEEVGSKRIVVVTG
jgi:hypothetical protein